MVVIGLFSRLAISFKVLLLGMRKAIVFSGFVVGMMRLSCPGWNAFESFSVSSVIFALS